MAKCRAKIKFCYLIPGSYLHYYRIILHHKFTRDQSPLLNRARSRIEVSAANAGEKIKPSLEYKAGLFDSKIPTGIQVATQYQPTGSYMYMYVVPTYIATCSYPYKNATG